MTIAGDIPVRGSERPGSRPDQRVSLLVWAAVVAVAAVWFLTLGLRHLLPSDEGRYAEIAREMFETGDWVTIRYNGLQYFEKPPFQMWATALAYTAFGVGDWQARLWTAISGAGGIAIVVLAARRWYGNRSALLAGCVLLAAPAWNIAGHFNSLDMGVAFALAGVLGGILIAQHPLATPVQSRRWMWFAWAAMAVAVLTKGLIGIVLPVAIIGIYAALARDRALLRKLHIASGLMVMLVIAVPWFVVVSIRNPAFPQFFFIHEHWQRYTSGVHHRGGAIWYFVPQLILGFLPWLGLAPRIVGVVAREWRSHGRSGEFRPALFLAVWAVAIFVFFSLSGSKLPGYIIPVYPALAILAAAALDGIEPKSWNRQIGAMLVLTTIGLAITPFMARFGTDAESIASYRSFAPWLAAACAVAIAGLACARALSRRAPVQSIVSYSLAMFALTTLALLGHESFGRNSSGIALIAPIRAAIDPTMPLYAVAHLDHTVPFYLRRTMVMVESPDELEFGTRQEPAKWLPTQDDFVRTWKLPAHAGALMTHDTFDKLRRQGLVMYPVAEDSRRIVVTNFQPPAR